MSIDKAIATLGIPGSIAVVIVLVFAVLQLIGELIEAFGRVVPTCFKVRKIFIQRREQKLQQQRTLQEIKEIIQQIQPHCDPEHIAERNAWMQWVNEKAIVYDSTVAEYRVSVNRITEALDKNTKMTAEMFVESSRDRIIDFASKVSNPVCYVSREEFHRIFKVYEKYERFLQEHNMTNGEVELNYRIIQDAYRDRTNTHNFIDDRLYRQPEENS